LYHYRAAVLRCRDGSLCRRTWSKVLGGYDNTYRYAANVPTQLTDPSGEFILPGGSGRRASGRRAIGGLASWASGGSFWSGAAQGAVAGGLGVLGGAAGAAIAGALGVGAVGAGIAGGALGGFAGDAGSQLLFNGPCEDFDWWRALQAAGIGALTGGLFARGPEFRIGDRARVAPFGNRTGHPTGEYPHYHRSVPHPTQPGQSAPGQGIGRHRPWDTRSTDTSWTDRF
jgi:hypothetical protein